MYVRLLIIAILAVPLSASAEVPQMEWWRTFGDVENDGANSVCQTSDGGYVLAGKYHPPGEPNPDAYILKVDADGQEVWSQTFGDLYRSWALCAIETDDDGIVATIFDDFSLILRKLRDDGYPIWTRDLGDASTSQDGNEVEQTADGGFAIYGHDAGQAQIIKTSEEGIEVWRRLYGGEGNEAAHAGLQTTDGGYLIVGLSTSYGTGTEQDLYLVKTANDGTLEWFRSYGDGDHAEIAQDVDQAADGGYILVGTSTPIGSGTSDLLLMKTNADGFEEWTRVIDLNIQDTGRSVQSTPDGGFLVGGHTHTSADAEQVWMLKTDADGETEWEIVMGGPFDDTCRQAIRTADNGYVVAGSTEGLHNDPTDVMLIRFEGTTSSVAPGFGPVRADLAARVYPNPCPTQGAIAFTLPQAAWTSVELFDAQGRAVGSGTETSGRRWLAAGTQSVPFDGSKLAGGIYHYRIRAGQQACSGRLVIP